MPPRGKNVILVTYEITFEKLNLTSTGAKNYNAKRLILAWRRGTKKENKGESGAANCTQRVCHFKHTVTFQATLVQDKKTDEFEEKLLGIAVRVHDADAKPKKGVKVPKSIGKTLLDIGKYGNNNTSADTIVSLSSRKLPSVTVHINTTWERFNGKTLKAVEATEDPSKKAAANVKTLNANSQALGDKDEEDKKKKAEDEEKKKKKAEAKKAKSKKGKKEKGDGKDGDDSEVDGGSGKNKKKKKKGAGVEDTAAGVATAAEDGAASAAGAVGAAVVGAVDIAGITAQKPKSRIRCGDQEYDLETGSQGSNEEEMSEAVQFTEDVTDGDGNEDEPGLEHDPFDDGDADVDPAQRIGAALGRMSTGGGGGADMHENDDNDDVVFGEGFPLTVRDKDYDMGEADIEALYDTILYCIFLPVYREMDGGVSPMYLLYVFRTSLGLTKRNQDDLVDLALETSCSYEYALLQFKFQLQKLDSHPYYNRDTMRGLSSFLQWKDDEKKRLTDMIEKLQELANPDEVSQPSQKVIGHLNKLVKYRCHHLYHEMLSILFEYEKPSVERETMKAGDDESCEEPHGRRSTRAMSLSDVAPALLTESARWLLTEYGERHQIRPLYREICWLDVQARHFKPSLERQCAIFHSLQDVVTALQDDECTMSLQDEDLLNNTLNCIYGNLSRQFETLLSFVDMFESSASLKISMRMIEVANQAESRCPTRNVSVRSTLLKEYVQGAVQYQYKTMTKAVHDDLDSQGKKVKDADRLVNVCNLLTIEILNAQCLDSVFKDHFDIVSLCISEYLELLIDDVHTCLKPLSTLTAPAEVLPLCIKLRETNVQLLSMFPTNCVEVQSVSSVFHPFIAKWTASTFQRLRIWVRQTCGMDKWNRVPKMKHTRAVDDIFAKLNEPMHALRELSGAVVSDEDPNAVNMLTAYGEAVVCAIGEFYSECVHETFLESIPVPEGNQEELKKKFSTVVYDEKKKQTMKRKFVMEGTDILKTIPKKAVPDFEAEIPLLHVRASNLLAFGEQLDELVAKYPVEFMQTFTPALRALKKTISMELHLLTCWMNISIEKELDFFVNKNKAKTKPKLKRKGLDGLFEFLETELGVLSQGLDGNLLTAVLRKLWKTSVYDLQGLIVPNLPSSSADKIKQALTELQKFFDKFGRGFASFAALENETIRMLEANTS
eukprot:TRINITY_DN5756_c0_g1_i2.p1 TRINITY_DN5756_c0_g1~~TRINITY_DN5756_c0_g1_i2.p1  ORF type:complete len:1174 (-),score=322.10 TRINITY_DN5756_c0_g1_i2:34-3555(-)